jgi:hypothetical protein
MTHIVIRLPASGGSRRRNNADTKNLSNVDPLLFLKVFKIVGRRESFQWNLQQLSRMSYHVRFESSDQTFSGSGSDTTRFSL